MRKITARYRSLVRGLNRLYSLPLLLIRIVLAYGFFVPASMKWNDIGAIAAWFEGMGLPAPLFQAYLVASTEAAGVVLLALGLATRFISVPLIIIMIVAIRQVHGSNGFDAAGNGYEIPLYYALMLFLLFVSGPGKISIDHLISRRYCRE